MDLNYNMIFLQDYLKTLFKYILDNRGPDALKCLLTDLFEGKESKIINSKIQERLNNYSPETIKLIIERNVVLALENSVVGLNKTYWGKLKDIYPNISKNFIILYFDKYINFLKNPTDYYTKNIKDLNNTYDSAIKESMKLKNSFEDIINKTSNINLDYMRNLNANGRTISVGENRKGGIFLSKESNIGYGKFINKQEFLSNIKSISKSHKVISKKGKISNEELENIVNQIGQTISISDNEKNKNSRIITDVSAGRKAGNLFTGNNGFDLPNGDYVSVEELTLAINSYIKERDKKEEKIRIIKRKGIMRKAVAAALVAMSLLTVKVEALDKNKQVNNEIEYDETANSKMVENINKTKIINSNNNVVIEKNNIEPTSVISNSNYVEPILENSEVEEIAETKELNQSLDNVKTTEEVVVEETSEEQLEEIEIDKIKDTEINEKTIEIKEAEINNENPIEPVLEESNIDEVEEPIIPNETIESNNVTNEVNGQAVIDYALQFVGNDYVYGGTSLTNGTDCSGFTQKIYSNFGVEIPRTSYEQIHVGENIGVDLDKALPGDLLCFNGHVGIYMGDGKMVHADNKRNGINVNNVYYDKNKELKAIIRFDEINHDEVIGKTR